MMSGRRELAVLQELTLDIRWLGCYAMRMIKSHKDSDTESLAAGRYVRKFDSIRDSARRKLDLLKSAKGLADLANVPGNRLEALHGNREGQYSIRVNDQYRICFVPEGDDFTDVEITDYH